MKILIIGATHGNEHLGVNLYIYLLKKRSPLLEHINFIIGNPRAYAKKKRFTEQDINRSYGIYNNSYESKRADDIVEYIKRIRPDIVLDIHTTNCHQSESIIVGSYKSSVVGDFLAASHIENIVQIRGLHDITTAMPYVIGYEISRHDDEKLAIKGIEQDLLNYIDGKRLHRRKSLFEVKGKIYKHNIPLKSSETFVNFQKHVLGFVPILTGENSYKKQANYIGFKADRMRVIEL